MLRLIIQSGSLSGHQFQLERGNDSPLLIGRGRDCEVRFDEAVVSGRHALIEATGNFYRLIDQRSANGIYLNGKRVSSSILKSGDVISLGTTGPKMEIRLDEPASREVTSRIATKPTHRMRLYDTAASNRPTEQHQAYITGKWDMRQTANLIGFFNPYQDTGKESLHSTRASVLFVICAVLGLMLMGLVIANLGLVETLGAGILSAFSVTIYLTVFLWLDRYDPEPFRTLALAFAWGATVAILISLVFNESLAQSYGSTVVNIVSAPVIEESSKALGVLLIVLLFRHDFDSVVDGIVYAGVVALGFAAVENVLYYAQSYAHGGLRELTLTYVLRGILAPFSHVFFTGMTGIGFGVARETHNRALKFIAPVIGFAFAVLFHSFWNWLATGSSFIPGYVLLEMPLFSGFAGVIGYMVYREGRILKRTLAREVESGLLSQHHLDIAISVFRRTAWVLAAAGNREKYRARREYLKAIAKLGLCHWHKARATEANRDTDSFPMIARLQAEIFTLSTDVD
jgi:RsiW-degrading membrane proteinase PrsW (M82 family)